MYGHGAENRHFTLPEHELMIALKTPNVLIRIEGLPGRRRSRCPRPCSGTPSRAMIEHVDLIEVRRGEKVTVEIPVRVTGEVFSGGLLDQQLVQIAVEAEATHLPDGVDVDVEGAEVGTAVHAKDIALPKGTTLVTDPEALVLHVTRRADLGSSRPSWRGRAARRPAPGPEAEPSTGQPVGDWPAARPVRAGRSRAHG